jgi:hypothetical protein
MSSHVVSWSAVAVVVSAVPLRSVGGSGGQRGTVAVGRRQPFERCVRKFAVVHAAAIDDPWRRHEPTPLKLFVLVGGNADKSRDLFERQPERRQIRR